MSPRRRIEPGSNTGAVIVAAPANRRNWRDVVRSARGLPGLGIAASLLVIAALVLTSLMLWSHDSVRDGKLELTVEEVSPKQVRMRIDGDVMLVGMSGHEGFRDLEKRYDARLEGEIVYDRAAKRITKWNMAALGDYTGEWFTGTVRWQAATPLAPMPVLVVDTVPAPPRLSRTGAAALPIPAA